jgi:hypothetical protein
MSNKTLGQIAYEAFYGHRKGQGAIPKWPADVPSLCDDWEASAKAVFKEMRRRYATHPKLKDSWLDEFDFES